METLTVSIPTRTFILNKGNISLQGEKISPEGKEVIFYR